MKGYILFISFIYIILYYRYFFRTTDNIEIIQLPDDFEMIDWNLAIKSRNPIVFTIDKDVSIKTFNDISFNDSLFTCQNEKDKIKMPGKVFYRLCNEENKEKKLDKLYYVTKTKNSEDIFYNYLSFYSRQIFDINPDTYVIPKFCQFPIQSFKSYTFLWLTDGESNVILFPYNSQNKNTFQTTKNINFWKDKQQLNGSGYLEIKLRQNNVIAIPPHWWFTIDCKTPTIIYKINDLRF